MGWVRIMRRKPGLMKVAKVIEVRENAGYMGKWVHPVDIDGRIRLGHHVVHGTKAGASQRKDDHGYKIQ